MIEQEEPCRDLAGLVVPLAGRLAATGDRWEPYRLLDPGGASVAAAGAYFGHLQAAGRPALTIRSYGMDLLRWFRFLWAIGVPWNHAVRSDARDFCRWLRVAGNRSGRIGVSRIVMVPGSLRRIRRSELVAAEEWSQCVMSGRCGWWRARRGGRFPRWRLPGGSAG